MPHQTLISAVVGHALACQPSHASHSTVAPVSSAPNKAAASSSTPRRTFSAWTRSPETVTAAIAERCHNSWYSISATATLNLWRRRSFRLSTTCRFSLSECAFSSRSSRGRTPMGAMSSGGFVGDALRLEGFDDVALLDVSVVVQRDAALHAALHLADVVFEAPQRTDLPGVDYHVVAQQDR